MLAALLRCPCVMMTAAATFLWLSGAHVHAPCPSECHQAVVELFSCSHDIGSCGAGEECHSCEACGSAGGNSGDVSPSKRSREAGSAAVLFSPGVPAEPDRPVILQSPGGGPRARVPWSSGASPRSPPDPTPSS